MMYLVLFCMLSYFILVSFGYNKITFIICSHIKTSNHLSEFYVPEPSQSAPRSLHCRKLRYTCQFENPKTKTRKASKRLLVQQLLPSLQVLRPSLQLASVFMWTIWLLDEFTTKENKYTYKSKIQKLPLAYLTWDPGTSSIQKDQHLKHWFCVIDIIKYFIYIIIDILKAIISPDK